jgi:CubicO group peptidase (beta-lactamase class C family)
MSAPVVAWFPEWAGDARSAITLRDVLTHTSGLKVLSSGDVYNARDIVQLALSSPVATIAGVEYRYSNSTFNLLAGIVYRATGQHLDQVAAEGLFAPLGFGDWSWQHDSVGNPFCMASLSARADDVAKIREVLLAHGSWKGRQLVPATWIDAMKPKPPADVGLACFAQYEIIRSRMTAKLLDTWIAAGVDPELVEAVRPYAHASADPQEWRTKLDGKSFLNLQLKYTGEG